MKNEVVALFFGIPVVCIVIVVLSQFWDEMFKKKFVIDRRSGLPGHHSNRRRSIRSEIHHRRHYDLAAPAGHSETLPEALEAVGSPILEIAVDRR
jgi:hypothetical protein